MNMTSNCDVTNSGHQIQMTIIYHWMNPPHEDFLRTPLRVTQQETTFARTISTNQRLQTKTPEKEHFNMTNKAECETCFHANVLIFTYIFRCSGYRRCLKVLLEKRLSCGQGRCQDLAARGPKSRRGQKPEGGATFKKYCIRCMQQQEDLTWNGRHRFQMGGAGRHHWPSAGDGPGCSVFVNTARFLRFFFLETLCFS